jgi:hypothetical protein
VKEKNSGCLLCGDDIIYVSSPEKMVCDYCEKTVTGEAKCKSGHFICDSCHQTNPNDFIERFCRETSIQNPWEITNKILGNRTVKMHGPEHHFLVPAVLLSSYYNVLNQPGKKRQKISIARQRAEKVPGGYCGSHGTCGAAIGTGIFISLILDTTPVSDKEWQLSNLMTSKSLFSVAMSGGPRCCKRDTFLSIQEAVLFVSQKLHVEIPVSGNTKCSFFYLNKECLEKNCAYYPQ